MNKETILSKIIYFDFYHGIIPTLKENGKNEALGLCPFHQETNPSFSVNLESGLYHCFGCQAGGDIFAFYQKLKGVSFPDALREIGHMVGLNGKAEKYKVVATFKYHNESGQVVYWKERIEPGRNGQKKEFLFYHTEDGRKVPRRGRDPVPYSLSELVKEGGPIYFVEGEAKANLLNQWGFTACCFDTGADSPWRPDYLPHFRNRDVVLLPDNDEPGRAYSERITKALDSHAKSIKIVELPDLPEKGDILDWVKDPGNTKEIFLKIVESSPKWEPRIEETSESEESDESEAFPKDEKIIPLYSFDFDAFPPSLKKFISDTSESLQVEREIIASNALTILSGAIGNTIRVSPKEGYEIPPFLWLMIIAFTGYGKSHAIDKLINPLDKLQGVAFIEYKKELEEYEDKIRKAKRDKKAPWPKEEERPVLRHFKVSDTTTEALANVFRDDPRGTLIHLDELSGLILGLNQYKAKGRGSDRQKYLELFDARSWKIDRKTGVLFIPNTGAAIIGGIQPQIMPTVFSSDSFHDGLLPRYIMTHAKNKPQKFSRKSLTEEDLAPWKKLLTECHEIPLICAPDGFVKPKVMILSEEAVNIWIAFHDEFYTIGRYLSVEGKVFIPKLITYSLKFAGILHVIWQLSKRKSLTPIISAETTSHAIEITRYYAGQAVNILRLYSGENESHNEYQNGLIQTLWDLQGEVVNGKILLEKIRIAFNEDLLEAVKLTHNKQVGTMLRKLGLIVERGTGGPACLIFEMEKIKKLFLEKSSLSSLSSLNQLEDTQRSDESEENEETFLDEINTGDSGEDLSEVWI